MATTGKMTFDEVNTALKNLPLGEHKLIDIVAIILKCETFKEETLKSFVEATFGKGESVVKLDELYVDLNYQRKLKLKNLLRNLKTSKGFSKEKAGHIDVAVRSNGKKFVWDGFRRSIMALLCKMTEIAASTYNHADEFDSKKARRYEAELFLARNAKNEVMGAAEIFFARYAKGEDQAKKMASVLHMANINVCGLKPGGKNMGGFAFVEKSLGYHEIIDEESIKKTITDDDFVFASNAIQTAWSKDISVGAYLVIALANTRAVLRKSDNTNFTDADIENKLVSYASVKGNSQKTLTENRISNKPLESVTYIILRDVMKLNGKSKKLSGLDDEDIDLIEDQD